jgi:divalent metal cation (Fe/Co/Zn/Cd) transporter
VNLGRKVNFAALVVGMLVFVFGLNVIFRGTIRLLQLGDERYFVGGFFTLLGAYLIVASIGRRGKQ